MGCLGYLDFLVKISFKCLRGEGGGCMWLPLVIPVLTLGRLKQEDCSEFKTSLGYRVRLKKHHHQNKTTESQQPTRL